MPSERTEAQQLGVYLAYRSLVALANGSSPACVSLGGKLLLLVHAERAFAASIAGGASLVAMPDAVPAKAALRAGSCNFLVSDLDEAVRILKNEVRRGAAISVGLLRSLGEIERACVERGLQPDLLECAEATLEARGARVVAWQQAMQEGESLVAWSAPGGSLSNLRVVNALARRCITSSDAERERWLAHAPAVLGRQQQEGVPMSGDDIVRLLAALDMEPGALGCTVLAAGRQIWPRVRVESGS